MTIVQVNLDDKENEIVGICKIKNKLLTKASAIKKIVRQYKQ